MRQQNKMPEKFIRGRYFQKMLQEKYVQINLPELSDIRLGKYFVNREGPGNKRETECTQIKNVLCQRSLSRGRRA
jgi:hypothetical protein